MRRFIFAALVCCSYANAGLLPEHSKNKGIWQFAVEGLYADQSNNLPILYGTVPVGMQQQSSNNSFTTFGEHLFPDPDETWGFGAKIGYVFPTHKYDIQLKYFGIAAEASNNETIVLPLIADGQPVGTEVDEEFNLNSAELMFGSYFYPTQALTVRASFGVTFADIEQKNHTFLTNIGPPGTANAHIQSNFVGAGPKVQLDGAFDILKSLAIVGSFGLGTLWGEDEIKNDIVQVGTSHDYNDQYEDSNHKVSVEVDSKLGLLFAKSMGDATAINLEAGYKLFAYLNAFRNEQIEQMQPSPTNLLLFQSEADYTYAGPYVTLGVDFM